MLASEFTEFEAMMRRFEKIFGKSIDDETMQLYFNALREVPMGILRKKAEEYLKRAKFFPKPVDLRPKDAAPVRDAADDAAFKQAEEQAIRNLEELRARDPDEWMRRVAVSKGPDCNAIRLHRQFGSRLWYDLNERCWRV